jgi:hypothetical protein
VAQAAAVDDARFLDEFRPFRRGELALARRTADDADFLPIAERDLLRSALRLAQLSTLAAPDDLVETIGSFRLRLLQLLGPALPTDPKRLDARPLHELAPRVAHMVAGARRQVVEAGVAPESRLDAELADKKVALVMGGAGGAGFVFLGALAALESAGVTPSYMLGASIGALIGMLRGRTTHYDLEGLLEQAKRIETGRLYGPPRPPGRYGLPGALRFDPRAALAFFFTHADEPIRLRDLRIPTDALVTGLRPGALTRPREEYASVVGTHIDDPDEISHLRPATIRRIVGVMVELAVSRRVFAPVLLGADPVTADLEAMDAAGFSAAIPAMLHYDIFRKDPRADAILDHLFAEHDLVALVDGALVNLLPAHLAWRQLEEGRIGTRNSWIVAMDALVVAGGRNRLLLPMQRVLAATLQRDRAYWDLYVPFREAPFVLDIVPRPSLLREAAECGRREMEGAAAVLREGTAPLLRWSEIREAVPAWD